MISEAQRNCLEDCYVGAKKSGHIWPEMAACEAMEESAWGTTKLYVQGHNVFGEKQRVQDPLEYSTLILPTWEVVRGLRQNILAAFVQYPSFQACFADRMATLRRLAPEYPDYAAALAATSAEEFVTCVSRTWSTDPNRAKNVIEIYNAHKDLFPVFEASSTQQVSA